MGEESLWWVKTKQNQCGVIFSLFTALLPSSVNGKTENGRKNELLKQRGRWIRERV